MAINKKAKIIATNMYLYIGTCKDVTKIKLKSMNIKFKGQHVWPGGGIKQILWTQQSASLWSK